ncbi:hypothetical protein M409DRAFT_50267 [Zasmidium cellare ATCC 36951]|uniref:Uncharacterized protein n=1 Tax=Zasmidium cellare ATCC 36951 TaxID=1080233 RepID=A0A6A6D0A3_ZASCE|nr:uncharacterized protein M409DRAFT_50267 [Zasmidium cellare ATCC 36951]KAF2171592.1 hypothetical protein M409DRAFT_50267 [Zasmidium cellare ATCC 36951]
MTTVEATRCVGKTGVSDIAGCGLREPNDCDQEVYEESRGRQALLADWIRGKRSRVAGIVCSDIPSRRKRSMMQTRSPGGQQNDDHHGKLEARWNFPKRQVLDPSCRLVACPAQFQWPRGHGPHRGIVAEKDSSRKSWNCRRVVPAISQLIVGIYIGSAPRK